MAATRAPGRGQVAVAECDGLRTLHFGSEWVQGAMRVRAPWRLELEYQQQMMLCAAFLPQPATILQLGLGAAALTKYCHRHLTGAALTVVELDAQVIESARRWFALPPEDARLRVVQGDALAQLKAWQQGARSCDWLQTDLYDAEARGPVHDTPAFYRACAAVLAPGGIGVFNFFGSNWRQSAAGLEAAFGRRWLRLPPAQAGNVVVLAFAGPPVDWQPDTLRRRAHVLGRRFGWPADAWLEGARLATSRRKLPPGPAGWHY